MRAIGRVGRGTTCRILAHLRAISSWLGDSAVQRCKDSYSKPGAPGKGNEAARPRCKNLDGRRGVSARGPPGAVLRVAAVLPAGRGEPNDRGQVADSWSTSGPECERAFG